MVVTLVDLSLVAEMEEILVVVACLVAVEQLEFPTSVDKESFRLLVWGQSVPRL